MLSERMAPPPRIILLIRLLASRLHRLEHVPEFDTHALERRPHGSILRPAALHECSPARSWLLYIGAVSPLLGARNRRPEVCLCHSVVQERRICHALVGLHSSPQLPHDNPKAVHIDQFIYRVRRLQNLWRHPRQCAGVGLDAADICLPALLGQTKIRDLACRPTIPPAKQQVSTLQVKMDNAFRVKVLHALGCVESQHHADPALVETVLLSIHGRAQRA
mmetsp:Transcript_8397/g.21528  ORF Transcript_8397/g.21528 Transcript_8397/m.21528 type:complete len:220 (+) Transcript_8397:254-913(+)